MFITIWYYYLAIRFYCNLSLKSVNNGKNEIIVNRAKHQYWLNQLNLLHSLWYHV